MWTVTLTLTLERCLSTLWFTLKEMSGCFWGFGIKEKRNFQKHSWTTCSIQYVWKNIPYSFNVRFFTLRGQKMHCVFLSNSHLAALNSKGFVIVWRTLTGLLGGELVQSEMVCELFFFYHRLFFVFFKKKDKCNIHVGFHLTLLKSGQSITPPW